MTILRNTWVYTLRSKDVVMSVFKQFNASVEHENGKKLKCIRTGNREYLGAFGTYCRNQGIRHQKTPQLKWMQRNYCVFIGYGLDRIGYRFYTPLLKKLIRSCDVGFIEDQQLRDIDREKTSVSRISCIADVFSEPRLKS